jgi:hypothetical protein
MAVLLGILLIDTLGEKGLSETKAEVGYYPRRELALNAARQFLLSA